MSGCGGVVEDASGTRAPTQEVRLGEITSADDVVQHVAQAEKAHHGVDPDDLATLLVEKHDRGSIKDAEFACPFAGGAVGAVKAIKD